MRRNPTRLSHWWAKVKVFFLIENLLVGAAINNAEVNYLSTLVGR